MTGAFACSKGKGVKFLNLLGFFDYGMYWLGAAAAAGLVIMAMFVALVVALLRPGTSERTRRSLFRAPTLRGRLLIGFCLIGAVPVLTLPPLLALENARARQSEMAEALNTAANNLAHSITRLVKMEVAGADALAAHINAQKDFDPEVLEAWLLRHHNANPEFVSSWVARPDGKVVAATAFSEGDIRPWAGPLAGVALMDFFPPAVARGGLYVSPVMKGVAPRFLPMMVISAPLFLEGTKPWGFLQVQVNLNRIYRSVVSYESVPGRLLFLTDQYNRVIAASPELGFEKFQNLSNHPLVTDMVDGAGQSYGVKGEIETNKPAGHYLAMQRKLDSGWSAFAVASLAGVRSQALIYIGLSLFWVVIVGFLAVRLARVYGEIVGEPLQTLDHSLDVFDAERTMTMIPAAPPNAPAEIAQVFNRVRKSMEQNRDSYRNMLRAVTEGDALRRKLENIVDEQAPPEQPGDTSDPVEAPALDETGNATANNEAARADYISRWDPATELAGREVFEEFFSEAWALGCTDARPVGLLLFSVGFGQARPAANGSGVADAIFKATGGVLRNLAGRPLDLVARLDADKFVMVLPDTDLFGTLVVAERGRIALQKVLPESSGSQDLAANVGAASIAPNPKGDASGFLQMVQRVLTAAEKKDGTRVAYAGENHEITVLDVGQPLPIASTKPAPPASPASGEEASVDMLLELEKTMSTERDKLVPSFGGESSAADSMLELELEKTIVTANVTAASASSSDVANSDESSAYSDETNTIDWDD